MESGKEMPRAKAGDKLSKKANDRLFKQFKIVLGDVEPKSSGNSGQWLCIDCGELPQNNMMAWAHSDQHPKHRFAWRNFDSGKLEEP